MELNILKVLNSISPLTEQDCAELLKIFKTVVLKKGEMWLEQGKVNYNGAFVEEGYLRRYWLKDGEEITDVFYFENDFCADLSSIIGKVKPISNVVAMQRTTMTTFYYPEFNRLCAQSMTLEHAHRLILESVLLRFYQRTASFILQSPKERYDALVAAKSPILQRATQYHISSYLGIGPQHLSRLRAGK
jgi:CRP-like cAMP-binding protein